MASYYKHEVVSMTPAYTRADAPDTWGLGLPFVYDLKKHRTVYVNTSSALMLGFSPADVEVLRTNLFGALVHPEDQDPVSAELAQWGALTPGQERSVAYRIATPRGGTRRLACHITIVAQPNGEPRLAVGVAHRLAA